MACTKSRFLFYKFHQLNPFRSNLKLVSREPCIARQFSTKIKDIESHIAKIPTTSVRLNKAMQEYLRKAKEHEEFLKQEIAEYELGKKHLANMMGMNHNKMTQSDIDEAICYLFPSGLFVPKGRPSMKHPNEVFQKQKSPQFDETGRPYHYLFYTAKPNYSEILHECAAKLQELDKYEDEMLAKSFSPEPEHKVNASASLFLTKEELEAKLLEKLNDVEYKNFVAVMERILDHPYSNVVSKFIMNYRKILPAGQTIEEVPEPNVGEDGRRFITIKNAKRKSALATVTVREPGTGKIAINGQDIHYFEWMQSREQIVFPLLFTGMLNKIDIEATVELGGPTSQAGAIRFGLSMCLRSFVSKEMLLRMKIAGLLQRDFRKRERKKSGQEGARRKYTWLKR